MEELAHMESIRERITNAYPNDRLTFLGTNCDNAILGVCMQYGKGTRIAYEQHDGIIHLTHAPKCSGYPADAVDPPVFVSLVCGCGTPAIRDALREGFDPELQFLDPDDHDQDIIGVCFQPDRKPTVAYSYNRVLETLADDGVTTDEDFADWFDVNIIGSFDGPRIPVFIDIFGPSLLRA